MGRHSWRGLDDNVPQYDAGGSWLPAQLSVASQTAYPWKAVLRTGIQVIVALAVAVPGILSASGVDQGAAWCVAALTVSAGVTRIMAIPAVNEALTHLGLGAEPR